MISSFCLTGGNSLTKRLLRPCMVAAMLGAALTAPAAISSTILQISTDHANHRVTEGYANDIDQVFSEFALTKANPITSSTQKHNWMEPTIQISDVGTSIYSDGDNDGFFSHFSISFDADTNYGGTWVYARIYLRTGSGHYELFHTTELFEIYAVLGSDRYRLESKLVSNFPAAYYDIRIELYEVDNNALQDTVDASTHRTLFALPLEAEVVDDGPKNSIVHEHVGALTWNVLMVIGLFAVRRQRFNRLI